MTEAKDSTTAGGQEPSMEEILASIRKIISDDNVPTTPGTAAASATDVVDLTQLVQEDGSVVDVTPAVAETKPVPPAPKPAPPVMTPASISTERAPESILGSEPTASAAGSALSALANTLEIERLSTAPQSATYIGNGARTLEDMVLELMRPLLKDWLDKNLPATVDRLVQKEIERISKRTKE